MLISMAAVVVAKLTVMLTVVLLAVLQQADQIMSDPIVIALLALLGIPLVASALTTGLLKLTGWGVKPQTVVYAFCGLLVTGLSLLNGKVPLVDPSNPAATVAAWQIWIAAQAEWTKMLYDVVLKRIWPSPDVPPEIPEIPPPAFKR